MSKVKQVLRLHTQGVSNRRIALDLGLYKGTVNSYIRKIKDHGYDIAELLELDDPVLESKLFAGNPAYKDRRFEEFKGKIPYFEKELERPHVTRYLLWEEYRQDNPEGYGYSQFCFHLGQILSAANREASWSIAREKNFLLILQETHSRTLTARPVK